MVKRFAIFPDFASILDNKITHQVDYINIKFVAKKIHFVVAKNIT